MLFTHREQALRRLLLGGCLGVAGYLLLAFLSQPGAILGGSLRLSFTFCYNAGVPEALGVALGWAALLVSYLVAARCYRRREFSD